MDHAQLLESLTQEEKLDLLDALWIDLYERPEAPPTPQWQLDILADRRKAVVEGRASFVDWEEAKVRLRNLFK